MNKNFYELFGLNEILFTKINQITNNGALPEILSAVSNVFFIVNFAVAYIFICIYFYFKTLKSENKSKYFSPIYDELFRIGTCYTLFGFTFAGLKFSFNMPRPFCSLDPSQYITIANTESERCLSAFPSAHTGLSILVTYALWRHIGNPLRVFCCIVITMVATSRITLAMHYPADIIYSIIVTIIVITLGNITYNIIKAKIATPIKNIIIRLLFI